MSDSGDSSNGGDDWNDWNEEVQESTKDILYHDKDHESPSACLRHCSSEYGWDLRALAKALDFDIYHSIRMVNWMRREVATNRQAMGDDALMQHLKRPFEGGAKPDFLADDNLLHPYLADDALLASLSCEDWGEEGQEGAAGGGGGGELEALRRENEALREQVATQKGLIEAAKAAMLEGDEGPARGGGGFTSDARPSGKDLDELRGEVLALRKQLGVEGRAGGGEGMSDAEEFRYLREQRRQLSRQLRGGSDDEDMGGGRQHGRQRDTAENVAADRCYEKMSGGDKGYFNSYARFGIHHEMLSDAVRTEGYQRFLLNNPSLLKGKTVLDIGCGTGILSMMAAKAGAKRVVGIEMSDIVFDAQRIVQENGLSDIITLVRGKCEEVKLPPDVDKVDVVISEWMGYMLLYESMLDSVIYARDKWMHPDGVCMPHKCTMLIAGMADDRLDFWNDVYGFKMSTIRDKIKQSAHHDPAVEHFNGERHVVTSTCVLRTVDCQTCSVADLVFDAPFEVVADREATVVGLLNWFDTYFELKCDTPSMFSTGPFTPETHWKQSAFYLSRGVRMMPGDKLEGMVRLARHSRNHRHLEILIEWEHVPKEGQRSERVFQNFEFC